MIPFSAIDGATVISITAVIAAFIAAFVSLLKIGPERQAVYIGVQDTVIENLREEIERLRASEERQQAQIMTLRRQLAEEADRCERRIEELRKRLDGFEADG